MPGTPILEYFDLNRRAAAGLRAYKAVPGLPAMYYDGLRAGRAPASEDQPPASDEPPAPPAWKPMSVRDQLIMYFGVLIGVVFSASVQQFRAGGVVNLNITLGTVAVSAVVALVIIPVVFEKLSVTPNAPFLFKLGLFVQNGVFWHVLASSIGKTLTT